MASNAALGADRSEEDLLKQGVDARKRRDDATAFALFKEAYAIQHSPRAAAQMGLAEVALGRWVEAEAHLSEGLAAKNDPWIRKNAKPLSETLARVRREIGTLEVLGNPPGAEVVIEGEVRGTLPLSAPIPVRAGDLRFELRAPEHISETRTVRVNAKELTRETVSLSRLPSLPRVAKRDDAPGPAAGVARTGSAATSPTLPRIQERPRVVEPAATNAGRGARIAGMIAVGLGAAALGAGVVFGLKARAAGTSDSAADHFDPDAEKKGHRYQTLQWVGYGAGAALLTGGLISYLVGASNRRSEPAQLGLALTDAGALATWRGAF